MQHMGTKSRRADVAWNPKLAVLLADVANAANSTADQVVLAVNIAANILQTGDVIVVLMNGVVSNAAVASTYNFYLKTAATKRVTLTPAATTAVANSNKPWAAEFRLTVRSLGAAGTAVVDAQVSTSGGAVAVTAAQVTLPAAAAPATFAINTTAVLALELGFNWTTANAANIIIATQASVVVQ